MMKINQNVNNPAEVFSDLLGDKDTVQYWRAIKEGGPSKKTKGLEPSRDLIDFLNKRSFLQSSKTSEFIFAKSSESYSLNFFIN